MPIYEYICLGCGEDFEAVCLSSTIKGAVSGLRFPRN